MEETYTLDQLRKMNQLDGNKTLMFTNQVNKKLSQIEKENKLGDWLRKNHPKIWEKWLDTLPSATDLRKEFHKAGIKKI